MQYRCVSMTKSTGQRCTRSSFEVNVYDTSGELVAFGCCSRHRDYIYANCTFIDACMVLANLMNNLVLNNNNDVDDSSSLIVMHQLRQLRNHIINND